MSMPLVSAPVSSPVFAPKPKERISLSKRVFAEALRVKHADLHRAAVGGFADDLADIDGAEGVRIRGQGNHPTFVRHAREPAVVDRIGGDEPLFERPRHRHDLEDRPRLVDIGHRAVALAVHRRQLRVEEFVQVERGPIGQAEDTAGLRFGDDDDARLRGILLGGLLQGDLAGVLHQAVDREDDGAAVDGRDFPQTIAGDFAAAAIPLGFDPTLLPLQEAIQRLLDADRRHHLLVDVPDDVRGQLPFRIVPAILEFGPDGLELQFLDLFHGRLIAFPREDDPADPSVRRLRHRRAAAD